MVLAHRSKETANIRYKVREKCKDCGETRIDYQICEVDSIKYIHDKN